MKCTIKILFLIIAGNIFLSNVLFAQNNTLKKDASPPWYKRFVGKAGNENAIIHVQKSYRNACIILQIPSLEISFKHFLTLTDNKIEATPALYNTGEKTVFKAEIKETKLIGKLTLPTGTELNINAAEDYTNATKVKVYEYSYVEEGSFPSFANENNKYFYHY